ncbi:hypothetical protein OAT67_04525 [Bacteriovoracaceae bacterium]|nr:hypothetical protein [Bacteriovoracaceae bacterium]
MYSKLINWSLNEFSSLPWRKKRNLYTTLVSEIMLQQTTVSTVLNHYPVFIKKYPNIKSLSKISEEEICIAWKGLGYYRRARNLLKAAKTIDELGSFPKEKSELIKIPGIGEYTASALISIGDDRPELAIDANIERVVSRLYGVKEQKGLKLQKKIRTELYPKIEKLFKTYSSRELNEALMDLGRVYCQARKADCSICPMKSRCIAFKKGKPLDFPEKPKEKGSKKYYDLKLARFVVLHQGKVLGYVKNEQSWLSGQVEIPTFIIKSEDSSLVQYPKVRKVIKEKANGKIKSSITKYRIENHYWVVSKADFERISGISKGYKYFKFDRQMGNFSTTTLKILNKVIGD